MYRTSSFSELPEVVKNLLIINVLLFLATISLYYTQGIDLTKTLALHQFQSADFRLYQLITHMFMHADVIHLFANMFGIWMFGKVLENIWGGKRFLTFYIITGLGAALIYSGYIQFQISNINDVSNLLMESAKEGKYYVGNTDSKTLTSLVNTPMVGASGALFGLILAFGMLFPNTLLYIYLAIPIKAKYFVILYALLELHLGVIKHPDDHVAHFAHLGGMIFGFLLLKYWKKDRNTFY